MEKKRPPQSDNCECEGTIMMMILVSGSRHAVAIVVVVVVVAVVVVVVVVAAEAVAFLVVAVVVVLVVVVVAFVVVEGTLRRPDYCTSTQILLSCFCLRVCLSQCERVKCSTVCFSPCGK